MPSHVTVLIFFGVLLAGLLIGFAVHCVKKRVGRKESAVVIKGKFRHRSVLQKTNIVSKINMPADFNSCMPPPPHPPPNKLVNLSF